MTDHRSPAAAWEEAKRVLWTPRAELARTFAGSRDPGIARAAERLGKRRIHEEVLRLCEEALRGRRDFDECDEALLWRIVCLRVLGRDEECLRRLEEDFPGMGSTYLGYSGFALLLHSLGRSEEALASLKKETAGLRPDRAGIHRARARILQDLGRTEEALADEAAARKAPRPREWTIGAIVVGSTLLIAAALVELLSSHGSALQWTLRGILAMTLLTFVGWFQKDRCKNRRLRERLLRSRVLRAASPADREEVLNNGC